MLGPGHEGFFLGVKIGEKRLQDPDPREPH